MSFIFKDSYDYYTDLFTKWNVANTALINLSGTRSRTGIGCVLCFPFGPELNFPLEPGLVMGSAYNTESLSARQDIFGCISGTGVFRVRQVRCTLQSDGSVAVLAGNDPFPTILGTSAPGLLSSNLYAYVEMKIESFSLTGRVTIHVNGTQVLQVTGNTNPDGTGTAGTFYLGGTGGGLTSAHDDTYLLNLADSGVPGLPNNDFLGAIRNYAQAPIGNGSPLMWIPLSGTNWQEVSEIPPDGDTSYVSSGNVGDIDQYVYGTTGIVGPVTIFDVQHCMDARIDISGSRSIASCVNGIVGPPKGLTTSYDQVRTEYNGNPVNGLAWQLTDFATVRFGPKVTA